MLSTLGYSYDIFAIGFSAVSSPQLSGWWIALSARCQCTDVKLWPENFRALFFSIEHGLPARSLQRGATARSTSHDTRSIKDRGGGTGGECRLSKFGKAIVAYSYEAQGGIKSSVRAKQMMSIFGIGD